ncbi:hypothetical protein [Polaromonas sp.]|uniref:hypothetical protein n=1 Tax=Polaromonas sp. TaxID=1869339 RepID=UPI00272FB13E|nr:hypothetical protein [Polaromonas sp.]MDP1740978.1 hypothetical protein [Polaromonas sp.]
MFVTYKEHKAPLNPFGDGLAHWRAAELALQRPWFLVSLTQPESIDDDSSRVSRTMLVSNITDVEGLAQMEENGGLQLDSVFIVTPGPFNGTSQWKMEPLRAVWSAEEPSQIGQLADLYETAEGATYADSLLATPLKSFHKRVLYRTFPLK